MQAYRNLLGDSWDRLAPGVRVGLTSPLRAEGVMVVGRAQGLFSALFGALIPLPKSGPSVHCLLDVLDHQDYVLWKRRFGSMTFTTRQWVRNGLLIESAGLFRLVLRVREVDGAVEIDQVGLRLLGIPVPRAISPTVRALISGQTNSSWRVAVTIGHVWFGDVCRYRGIMEGTSPRSDRPTARVP